FSSGDTEPEPKPEVKAKPNPDIPDFIIQSIRHKHRCANACAIKVTTVNRTVLLSFLRRDPVYREKG
ncbi:hypothetical protein ACR79T_08770, partial [Sphingobacterium spiritivorum]|uniref:hypothetical protein n=1 Tax=Sphingobacterium spiritivorum TaxID=258 RepID=UPI003DA2FEF7